MHQYNIHKAKITAKAGKPAVKRDFTYKCGNGGCCGTLILFIVLLIIFSILGLI